MMPRVIGNDSLIARVNEVQGCMYRQSNELGRLNKAVKRYKDENAKLRELAGLLLYGMSHDAPPHEVLLWSQKVNRLIDELGIKEDG